MMELNSARKIKINLSDYDYESDINNRLLMTNFSETDRQVLEEILFCPVKIPIFKLEKSLDLDYDTLTKSLGKISKTGLFEYLDDHIIVDKQLRKYYESQMMKFDSSFKPDLEYIQVLLKKVPIHILPNWYSVPRTSNNIFESLIEKYLLTPHHFQRYIEEIQSKDKLIENMIHDVFTSKNYKVFADDLKKKYNLSDYDFEKYMLMLEYSFVLCLSYSNVNGFWKETITPFYQWQKYLKFLDETDAKEISEETRVKRKYSSDFIYIEHLSKILEKIGSISFSLGSDQSLAIDNKSIESIEKLLNLNTEDIPFSKEYIEEMVEKLLNLSLVKIEGKSFKPTKEAKSWLLLSSDKKALAIYQNPSNQLSKGKYPQNTFSISNIRRAEKSILRVLNSSWVYFDDFMKGLMIPITDDQFVFLKKEGKNWEYVLPKYTEEQLNLIKVVVLKWLYENAIVAVGKDQNKICFKVTDFGKTIFEI